MIEVNALVLFAAALIPLVVGFVWYNPKVFGNAWMIASGLDEEKIKGANMAVIFILSYVFAVFVAFGLQSVVIHQWGAFSSMMNHDVMVEGSEANVYFKDFMSKYGTEFRTFKHGAFHGFLISLMFALPFIGTNALFERKGFKYIAINVGYWIITLTLMGGVICQFA